MVHALGFDEGRPAFVVLAGIGPARGDELLLALGDQGLVFAVGRDDDAQFPGELEGAVELRVVDPEGTLVSEEDLERADPAVHDRAQLGLVGLVVPGDAHVEREIARGLPSAFAIQCSNAARASSLLAGQHISMRLVVPPTIAARLAVS